MKKFSIPVKWTVQSYVVVEAENEEDAAHEAMGIDPDTIPQSSQEYVDFSFEIDEYEITELPKGDT